MKKNLYFLLFALLGFFPAKASHFQGVSMWYECLGGCHYRVYHSTIIDCGGSAMMSYLPLNYGNIYPSPYVSATGVGGTPPPVPSSWNFARQTEISPVCPIYQTECDIAGAAILGMVEVTYYMDYDLCNTTCSAVTLFWSNCCRNYALTNGAGGASIYLDVTIYPNANNCNSSPQFLQEPVAYTSTGNSSSISQAAFDPDGDSLVYSLVDGKTTGPNAYISYSAGYSGTQPLGANWNVTINPQTGVIDFVPTTGGYALGSMVVQVEEYRNGVLIGKITRDCAIFTINTQAGTPIPPPPTDSLYNITGAIYGPYKNELHVTPNIPISFNLWAGNGTTNPLYYELIYPFPTPPLSLTGTNYTNPLQLTANYTASWSEASNIYHLVFDYADTTTCPISQHGFRFLKLIVDSLPILATTANITHSNCNSPTGSIDLSVTGDNPPYTFSWNTGATTEDISNIPIGAYWAKVTDALGYFLYTDTFFVNVNTITVNLQNYPPDCDQTNGAMKVNATGGVLPYNYLWNTGATTDSIGNLGIGGYSVDVTDANGCLFHKADLLNYDPLDSCFSIISGKLFQDPNTNCILDPWEAPLSYGYIGCSAGMAVLTDNQGNFSFTVLDTGYYTLTYSPYYLSLANSNCVNSFSIIVHVDSLGKVYSHNDMALELMVDFAAYVGIGTYNPGFPHQSTLYLSNYTGFASTATVQYQHKGILLNPSFSVQPVNYDPITRIATWNLNSLWINTQQIIHINGMTDPMANLGDTIYENVQIIPSLFDAYPYNNTDTTCRVVGGSFDPNHKLNFPMGETANGLIPPTTSVIDYTVEFQNTGNAPAQFVVIRDTLDDDLEITSLVFQAASHNCTITIEDNKVVVFTFLDINLSDSTSDEPNSHGFVKFSVHLKPNLPLDTKIDNKAYIYFDFNSPILTNSTSNILYEKLMINSYDSLICVGDYWNVSAQKGKLPYTLNISGNNFTSVNGNFQLPLTLAVGTYNFTIADFYGVSTHGQVLILEKANAQFSYTNSVGTCYFTPAITTFPYYFWDFGNGQTSNQSTPVMSFAAGTYSVSLITLDNCGNVDTTTQTLVITTDISQQNFQQSIQFLPNPSKDYIEFHFPNPENELYTLILYDLQGKEIQRKENIRGEEAKINFEKPGQGSFLWELKGKYIARGRGVRE